MIFGQKIALQFPGIRSLTKKTADRFKERKNSQIENQQKSTD
jgi:hypothetical protein